MGYYSLYRIIKDILYNFKKNKLLVIIAIFILLIFLCNKVFADDFTFTINNIPFLINYENHIAQFNGESVLTDSQIWNNEIIIITKNSYCGVYLLPKNQKLSFYNDYFHYTTTLLQYVDSYPNTNFVFLFPKNINKFEYNSNSLKQFNIPGNANINDVSFSSCDILDINNNVIRKSDLLAYPKITNSLEDLQTLNFDTISVSAWDWSNKDLYILFYDRTLMNNQNTEGLYPKKEIKLTKETSYYIPEISSEQNAIYFVANDNTGLNFKIGGKYEIRLAERVPQSTGRWLSWRRLIQL